MTADNLAQVLTTNDLNQLRTSQSVITTPAVAAPIAVVSVVAAVSATPTIVNVTANTIGLRDAVATRLAGSTYAPVIPRNLMTNANSSVATITNIASSSSNSTNTSNAYTNNLNNLLTAASKTATLLPFNGQNKYLKGNAALSVMPSSSSCIPTASKYVLLQQNRNGQFTPYEGSFINGSGGGASISTTSPTSAGSIVVLTSDHLQAHSNNNSNATQQQRQQQQQVLTASNCDNDEELRSLAWLNNSNLIKEIVTTNSTTSGTRRTLVTNHNSGNIHVINTITNPHDLIEELPTHMTEEEHQTAAGTFLTNSINTSTAMMVDSSSDNTQVTTFNVSDFQQQFKRFSNGDNYKETTSDQVYGNVAALGPTATVHVGPSGTTTVVEYKPGTNFLQARQLFINSAASGGANQTSAATNSMISGTTNKNVVNKISGSHTMVTPSTTTILLTSNSKSEAKKQSVMENGLGIKTLGQIVTSTNGINSGPNHILIRPNNAYVKAIVNGNTTSVVGSSNSSSSGPTTTHHPHKKYLREKMNALAEQNGTGSAGSCAKPDGFIRTATQLQNNAAVITDVNTMLATTSPAITSPLVLPPTSVITVPNKSSLSKTPSFAPIPVQYNNAGNTSLITISTPANPTTQIPAGYTLVNHPVLVQSTSPSVTSAMAATKTTTSSINIKTTIANNPLQQRVISPTAVSAYESVQVQASSASHSTKDCFTQQQALQHSVSSPTSYSSYETDSLKEFDVNNGLNIAHTSDNHQQRSSSPGCLPIKSIAAVDSNDSSQQQQQHSLQKQKHPNTVPWDPLTNAHNKPPYSFSSLIFMAIEGSQEKALPVKEIYAWIVQHFPYFKTAPNGWKNSVRHNLSLNKSFVKVEKAPNMGKGSLWRVEQQQRPNLMQALNRSPFYQTGSIEKSSLKSPIGSNTSTNSSSNGYDVVDAFKMHSSNASSIITSSTPPSPPSLPPPTTTTSIHINHIHSRFDPNLFPNLSKVFKDITDISNDAINHNNYSSNDNNDEDANLADAVDDYPSDFTTISKNKAIQLPANTNFSNDNNANHVPDSSFSNTLASSVGCRGADSAMALPNYEHIERLVRDCGADSIEDVNAATAMLALKHGPKVFAESFQNGAPVLTSSPSEDHTYSAGGIGGVSGSSTPVANDTGFALLLNGNASNPHSSVDAQSTCASSDAAYESSEECHNVSLVELENQRRHLDGVDALLSLSLSSGIDSSSTNTTNSQNSSLNSNSPHKRASSTTVEEEYTSSQEKSYRGHQSLPSQYNLNKMTILSKAAATMYTPVSSNNSRHLANSNHQKMNEHKSNGTSITSNKGSVGINNDNSSNGHIFYGGNYQASQQAQQPQQQRHNLSVIVGGDKKSKPIRSIRTKLKRKAPWMR